MIEVLLTVWAATASATLGSALKSVDLPNVDSTDALDRTLPALIVAADGSLAVARGAGTDATIVGARLKPAAATAQLAALLKAEEATSAALFVDERAAPAAFAAGLAAAERAGAQSFSIAVNGLRAVRAARPPACDRGDVLDDRCAAVGLLVTKDGIVASALDIQVGVEGCEPPVGPRARPRKPPPDLSPWSGVALAGAGGACPALGVADGGPVVSDAPVLVKRIQQAVGDCARARVVVGDGADVSSVARLVRELRERGVAVTLRADAKATARAACKRTMTLETLTPPPAKRRDLPDGGAPR